MSKSHDSTEKPSFLEQAVALHREVTMAPAPFPKIEDQVDIDKAEMPVPSLRTRAMHWLGGRWAG